MNLFQLSEYTALKALTDKLLPNELSTHRYICREYSQLFSTPLAQVLEMNPEEVLLALHESRLDQKNLENDEHLETVIEAIFQINDPSYDKKRDEEESKWNEEIAKKRSTFNTKEIKKQPDEAKLHPELPKSGGVNFSYLADLPDQEG